MRKLIFQSTFQFQKEVKMNRTDKTDMTDMTDCKITTKLDNEIEIKNLKFTYFLTTILYITGAVIVSDNIIIMSFLLGMTATSYVAHVAVSILQIINKLKNEQ